MKKNCCSGASGERRERREFVRLGCSDRKSELSPTLQNNNFEVIRPNCQRPFAPVLKGLLRCTQLSRLFYWIGKRRVRVSGWITRGACWQRHGRNLSSNRVRNLELFVPRRRLHKTSISRGGKVLSMCSCPHCEPQFSYEDLP